MHVPRMPVFMVHVSMMHLYMMHVCMMHVCMIHVHLMHISMTLDLDAGVYDAYIFDHWPWCTGMMHVCMTVWFMYLWSLTLILMDISMIFYPWPWCIYACIHDAYIYIWSLSLMHVCMLQVWIKHTSMILDPGACIYDAGLFRYQRTNGPTDEQGDSRSWIIFSIWFGHTKP